MTPPPGNNKGYLKIAGAIILIAIICLVIAVVMTGAFLPSSQQQVPSQNISPVSPLIPLTPSMNPSTSPSGASGTIAPVTLAGTNFAYGPAPSVWLSRVGEPDIFATDVAVISPTQLTCTFPLPASPASAGEWDIFVKNYGEQSGSKIGVFMVLDEISPPLTWDWSVDGWGDWQHDASCTGTPATKTGSCREYGPIMVDGHGEHGSEVNLVSIPTQSRVWKTFTARTGTRWNTLTFSGLLSSSSLPVARWIAIEVNGERVFYADATRSPPGNGQKFTITQSFTPANSVTVRISGGQDPTYGVSLYATQFNSLTLS
ncbi:MAG: hypothetical protein CVV30_01190 [Methanomicrobiales archaeon HGW-Methanomicrobiales-1]|nr:MAG: hypothetical protein CVV30_01190 [Methanomicrobiales archaeon HGW-Methanomicrobiales-1]